MTRRNTGAFFLLPILLFLLPACGKDKGDNAPPADKYSQYFKNTLWGGEFKYSTRTYQEPMGVSFNENGTFIWREMDADAAGTYTIDQAAGRLNMAFTLSSSKMSAKISDDGKLSDFSYGQAGWEIRSFQLSAIAATGLNGTSWKCSNESVTISNITFYPNNVVADSPSDIRFNYQQGSQVVRFGRSIRGLVDVDFTYLLVQVTDNAMIGLEKRDFVGKNLTNYYQFNMAKK